MALGDLFNGAQQSAEELNQELAFIADAVSSIGDKLKSELEDKLNGASDAAKRLGKGLKQDFKDTSKIVEDLVKAQARQEKGLLTQSEITKLQNRLIDLQAVKEHRINQLKLKGIELSEEDLKAMNEEIKAAEEVLESIENKQNRFGGLAALANEKFKSLKLNIKDIAAAGLKYMIDRLKEVDEETTSIRNNFGVTKGEAIIINQTLARTALSAKTLGVNLESVTAATNSLNAKLGGTANLFTTDIRNESAYLTERLGLSVEEAAKLEEGVVAAGRAGGNLSKQTESARKSIKASTGVSLSFRDILKDSANQSGALLLNLEATPGQLQKAVAQAKALGTQLKDIEGIQSSILDFETSIANELAAEAITGKELNLERARLAAMTNDYIGLTQEVVSQFGSIAEFQSMGYFQQEAFAKAVGLSKDRLAEILRTQGAINNSLATGVETQAESTEAGAAALSAQDKLTESINILNSVLKSSLGLMIGLATAFGILLAIPTGGISLGASAALVAGLGGAGLAVGAAVSDGIAPADKGPFTITDSYGATAVTAKGDGVVVSPNISQGGGEGITKAQANEMIALLKKVANKDFSINMDGRKLSDAIATSGVSYNV